MSSKISPVYMKNPATHRPSREEFNEFTKHIRSRSECEQKTTLVKLRNGSIVEVYWFDLDGPEYAMFASDTGMPYRWNWDGTSITSQDFDMMTTFV